MTLPRLYAFNTYWERHPPVQILLAERFGVKPKAKAAVKKSAEEMMAEFAAMGFEVKR